MNFLDTNILVYAFSAGSKAEIAQSLMAEPFVLSVQALNEFANVGRKKFGLSWERIASAVEDVSVVAASVVAVTPQTTQTALKLASRYNFSFYDALMVAAALNASCSRYYSEDLHHGLMVEEKLTIINPFH